jgi:hypothetical protein
MPGKAHLMEARFKVDMRIGCQGFHSPEEREERGGVLQIPSNVNKDESTAGSEAGVRGAKERVGRGRKDLEKYPQRSWMPGSSASKVQTFSTLFISPESNASVTRE